MGGKPGYLLTDDERLAYAEKLKSYATIEAQRETADPAAAVATIEWMIGNYSRPQGVE